MTWMNELPVTLAHLVLRPRRAWRPSPVPGATVRSALLAHLRSLICIQSRDDCGGCPLRHDCPYPTFWHPLDTNVPRWWLSPAAVQHHRCTPVRPLEITLGAAGEVPMPHVIPEALRRTARQGLGKDRVRHSVASLTCEGDGGPTTVMDGDQVVGRWSAPTRLAELVPRVPSGARRLVLTSPHRHPTAPTVATWLTSAMGRLRGLARSAGVSLPVRWPDPGDEPTRYRDVRLVRASRFSNGGGRQDLSGWVGSLGLAGETVRRFGDLIAAAQVVGSSRSATCGLGSVQVVQDSLGDGVEPCDTKLTKGAATGMSPIEEPA